jgi:integrase
MKFILDKINKCSYDIIENFIEPHEYTYLKAATSQNTRRAYQQDITHFIGWGGILPATPDIVLQYLHTYAPHLNPRTLKRRLIAIKHWHTYQGFSDPTMYPLVKKTLSGILHVHGRPAEKAPAFSIEQLMLLSHYLKSHSDLISIRDQALIQIGFFGAFRRSELIAMHWEHVTFVPKGIEILIPRSKTDQEGEGQICAIPYGNSVLCPVTTLHNWQKLSGIERGAIFRRVFKSGRISDDAISSGTVNSIIKKLAITCQLPKAEQFSGHSLRRGFATVASQKGATLGAIMRQGRWRHEGTVNGYIEEGQRFDKNAADSILSNIPVSITEE